MNQPSCEVWFYHLERSSLDEVLPELLEKTLARGWRALVKMKTLGELEHLDAWLWTYRDDGFLAHGPASESDADRQPILLTLADANLNQAQALFLVEGADAPDLNDYQRCVVVFDGRDDVALAAARGIWSAVRSAGHHAAYWRQGEHRGWERQSS